MFVVEEVEVRGCEAGLLVLLVLILASFLQWNGKDGITFDPSRPSFGWKPGIMN